MEGQPGNILQRIEDAIDRNEYRQALSLITENAAPLLSSHDIKPVMLLILKIPDEYFDSCFQKLIKGWLLLLCSENHLLAGIMQELEGVRLSDPLENSLYHSLKAISTFPENSQEALGYAKLSVDALDGEKDSFFKANARLTYGQLLSGIGENRRAMQEIFSAYSLFKKSKSYFPAVVSLVHYGLKKHALGEATGITRLFSSELAACGRLEKNGLFDLLKLPLGIAHFELNRQIQAMECLESAKPRIYELGFTHMYGVIEMYLVGAYLASGLCDKAHAVIDELSGRLSGLRFEKANNLCAALRAHVCVMAGSKVSDSDRELLESDYMANGEATPAGALLALARLKLAGQIENFNFSDLLACHKSLEAAGNIPLSQTAAILISEYYYRMRDMSLSAVYLEKAVDIFMSNRLSARFLLERAECLSMLKEINRDLHKLVSRKRGRRRTAQGR